MEGQYLYRESGQFANVAALAVMTAMSSNF
jgi:hypothetical protein